MKNFKVLLIGQPNVGKSSLLNALVGSKAVISNYPGTTVEITEGEKILDEIKILFEDTPGIYSISDRSEEEKVTEEALFEEKIVVPLLAIGGVIYAILNMTGITKGIVEPLSIFTRWLGLPAVTIIPLAFGFLQKDLTGAMLLSVLGSNISLALTPIQIYTFGVAATMQIPCIIALGMLIREFGVKNAILLTGISIIYGFLFAGLVWRIISIFGKYLT